MAKIKKSKSSKASLAEQFIYFDQFILGVAVGAVIGALLVSVILIVSVNEANDATLQNLKQVAPIVNSY